MDTSDDDFDTKRPHKKRAMSVNGSQDTTPISLPCPLLLRWFNPDSYTAIPPSSEQKNKRANATMQDQVPWSDFQLVLHQIHGELVSATARFWNANHALQNRKLASYLPGSGVIHGNWTAQGGPLGAMSYNIPPRDLRIRQCSARYSARGTPLHTTLVWVNGDGFRVLWILHLMWGSCILIFRDYRPHSYFVIASSHYGHAMTTLKNV